jgi:hypothetical protein
MKKDPDASIDRLLAGALKARGGEAAVGACLDAETLAAWADGTLDARGQATAEAHAADCARCQQLLAAMVRTLPQPVAKSWWRMPALGWLVPLTAAATALVIWVAVPRPTPVQVSEIASPVDRLEPAPLSAPVDVATPKTRAKAEADAEPQRQVAAERDMKRSLVPAAPLEEKREAAAAENQATSAPAPARGTALSETFAPAAPVAGAGAVPTPPPPAAEPSPSADSSANLRRRVPLTSAQVSTFASVPETIVVSSNPSTRFRLLRGGGVQRSADAGATWRTEATGATETLTAGASPSPSVCWLVGPSGTVLLSTDGRSWRRVAFPETVDLRSVTATDHESATVTTADGGAFVTADGGQTWSRTPGL